MEQQPVLVHVSSLCIETYPCRHDCTVRFADGTEKSVCYSSRAIEAAFNGGHFELSALAALEDGHFRVDAEAVAKRRAVLEQSE